jgi:tocopherol O-methyltransferase
MHKLVEFYEDKTATILRKYGAGPLVHYHTGVMDEAPPATASPTYLRASLIASQENILRHASKAWSIKTIPFEDVLDVGCGLGGGAIFWAREFGAHVTAITIAPSHIALVREFAARAEMEARVQPFLCDALQVPGESRFDAAVAIDSSSSFSRKPWFQRWLERCVPMGVSLSSIASLEVQNAKTHSIGIGAHKSALSPNTSRPLWKRASN